MQINTDDIVKSAIYGGPFGVMVATMMIMATRWKDIPEAVLVKAMDHAPWLIVVMLMLWLFLIIMKQHRDDRTESERQHRADRHDLVDSLGKRHDKMEELVESNTVAMTRLTGAIENLN